MPGAADFEVAAPTMCQTGQRPSGALQRVRLQRRWLELADRGMLRDVHPRPHPSRRCISDGRRGTLASGNPAPRALGNRERGALDAAHKGMVAGLVNNHGGPVGSRRALREVISDIVGDAMNDLVARHLGDTMVARHRTDADGSPNQTAPEVPMAAVKKRGVVTIRKPPGAVYDVATIGGGLNGAA